MIGKEIMKKEPYFQPYNKFHNSFYSMKIIINLHLKVEKSAQNAQDLNINQKLVTFRILLCLLS